ncbi:dihydrofolate reductase [Bradyrhizobium sp. USDA 4341]
MSDIVELTVRPTPLIPPRRSADDAPAVSLIAAMSLDRTIGRDGKLPWRLSTDLARFKAATMGKPVIVGRKTYDDIGRPLPGRMLIVLTRTPPTSSPNGVRYVRSMDDAMSQARLVAEELGAEEIFIAGGAEIYRQALPLARRILLTVVDAHIHGDARFPDFSMDTWSEVGRQIVPAGQKDEYKTTVLDLRR